MNRETSTIKFPQNNLKSIRKKKDWTQQKVCDELKKYNCHISRSTYARYETGDRVPSFNTVIALSKCFGTTINCILGLSDYNPCATVRICKNEFCIYYFCKQCLLDNISVDENGYCENSKYIPDSSDTDFIENRIFIRLFYN